MKKLLPFFFLCCSIFSNLKTNAQATGDNCAQAFPFCTGTTYTFPNNTSQPSLGAGGIYGCLGSTPNPVWYYMEILNSGNLDITMNQTSSGGSGIDVDFVCWGPFSSQAAGCSSLSAGNIVDCSYSTAATEVVNIPSAVTGQYYILLLTNYSNLPGTITFSQTGGAGSTNCGILCAAPLVTAGSPQTLTCTTTSVSLSASSSTPGVVYSWSGPGGYTSASQNPSGITTAGTYTVTATDPLNPACPATATQVVNTNTTPPGASTGSAQTITCSATSATLGASSGTAGATYSWSGPAGFSSSAQNPSGVTSAGTYTVTVTDPANGCSFSTTQDVLVNNTLPDASVGPDETLSCTTTSTLLSGSSATPGAIFNWDGPSGFSSAIQNPSVTAAGTYTLTVTDPSNGCTITVTQEVFPSLGSPDISAGTTQLLTCSTGSVNISGSSTTAGATFSWSGPGGFSAATALASTAVAGTYTLTVTDPSNGCTSTSTQVVNADTTAPNATAGSALEITCTSTTVNLSGASSSASSSYLWNGPAGFSSTSLSPLVSSAGTYTLTVTDSLNGCSSVVTQDVNLNNSVPSVNTGSAVTLTCTAATVNLTGSSATAGATYSWTGPAGFSSASASPSVNTAGTYTLVVTDPANGCTSTSTQLVNPNTGAPNITVPSALTLTCAVTSVNLQGISSTPGVTYSWSGPAGFSSTLAAPSVTGAGTYTLVVTDPSNGCTTTVTQVVSSNTTVPLADAGVSQNIPCSSVSTTLNGNNSSSGANYSYSWSGPGIISGGSTTTPVVGAAGTYTLTVTDNSNGCFSTDIVPVSQDVAPTASFTADPMSGLAPLFVNFTNTSSNASTYEWSFGNGSTSTSVDPSATFDQYGSYTVTLIATGANGCADTVTATILAEAISAMVIPNIFTPNGDLDNELFSVTAVAITTFEAQIFDRWGLKMYEWNDVNGGWNGQSKNGKPAPDGTYFYMITATGFDGKIYKYQGYLSLAR
jgi:gliding motility-associated-like protein